MADRDVDVVVPVADVGDREQRGDRPALDDVEVIVDQAPFDVLRGPKCDSICRPSCTSRTTCESVSAGCSTATVLSMTSSSRTLYTSAFTKPETRASPSPKPASTVVTFRFDVTGSAVNRMPAASGVDHLLHDHGHVDLPLVEAVPQAVGHGTVGEQDAQQRRTGWRIAAGPTMFRYVSCWPAKESRRQVLRRRAGSHRVGGLLAEPASALVIAAATASGMAVSSRVRRIPALSVRIDSRSSGFRRDSRSSRSSIDGASDRTAGMRPSSRKSQRARGCLRSAPAPPGARPCRRRPRPAFGRAHGDPARSSRAGRCRGSISFASRGLQIVVAGELSGLRWHPLAALPLAMAGVDDTEAIPLRIGKHDEVGVRWIRVPRHAGGAEADQSLDLGGLFGSVVDDEVQMDSRMLLSRRIRPLERSSRSLADGGTRIVNPLLAAAERTGSYPRTWDQKDTARSTSSAPSTTVPRRIMMRVDTPRARARRGGTGFRTDALGTESHAGSVSRAMGSLIKKRRKECARRSTRRRLPYPSPAPTWQVPFRFSSRRFGSRPPAPSAGGRCAVREV